MLLAFLAINFSMFCGWRWHNNRAQRRMELRRWQPFKQNPIVDRALRHFAGEIKDPKQRWAAEKLKRTARNFVNSESFSIAVDGLVNQQSDFWRAGRNIHKRFTARSAMTMAPTSREECTIR